MWTVLGSPTWAFAAYLNPVGRISDLANLNLVVLKRVGPSCFSWCQSPSRLRLTSSAACVLCPAYDLQAALLRRSSHCRCHNCSKFSSVWTLCHLTCRPLLEFLFASAHFSKVALFLKVTFSSWQARYRNHKIWRDYSFCFLECQRGLPAYSFGFVYQNSLKFLTSEWVGCLQVLGSAQCPTDVVPSPHHSWTISRKSHTSSQDHD